ncbi:uncharacterized protein K444DRAFT_631053 [Hyaloscypha bicolor E]|uniref:Peptidase A1 domain-containing protein n=1 Tax=Hyaloscypha bicolor E TaxID=1095630 RepID=A0A2J6T613_9HELO|nr:uncharacterized protein K444DRAFT_631053 [Hyaloscypha bicolor E]PMD58460.1 hypothetical protein K444DRAFT_631053 [Hyaloscypha bicolor E]
MTISTKADYLVLESSVGSSSFQTVQTSQAVVVCVCFLVPSWVFEKLKREINGHVPTNRFRPRDSNAAAVGFTDEVSIPNTWFVAVDIGNPPQTFLFNPDSGAPDFMALTPLTGRTYSQPVHNYALSSTSAATPGS